MNDRPTPGVAGSARSFTDSVGVAWSVREIIPSPLPPKLRQMLGEDRRSGGWLLFLSGDGEKRRLSPVPRGWANVSEFELERWCMRAACVPPAPERRAADRKPPS
jgi:hypothetical protein